MMMSQILKFVDFTKTQKFRYLENETLFVLQIEKSINYTSSDTFIAKNRFVAEVTFNIPLYILLTKALKNPRGSLIELITDSITLLAKGVSSNFFLKVNVSSPIAQQIPNAFSFGT